MTIAYGIIDAQSGFMPVQANVAGAGSWRCMRKI
jgi:hypothetical protein